MTNPYSKRQKAELLRRIEAGEIKIADLLPTGEVIIYHPEGLYSLSSNPFEKLTQEQMEEKVKHAKTKLFLPDNGRTTI